MRQVEVSAKIPVKVTNSYQQFQAALTEFYQLKSVLALLDWDHQVYMPEKGAMRRAEVTAYLTGLLHSKFTSSEFEKLLEQVKRQDTQRKLTKKQAVVVREVAREFEREKKLPEKFVKELAQLTSEAHQVWAKARETNNFKLFQPYLERILKLKRQEAEHVGFKDSPYDALLDTYEPEMTTARLESIFSELKEFLVPFIKKIKMQNSKVKIKSLKGNYPIDKQQELGRILAQKLGFDLKAGRIDAAIHPFATNFHPEDVRITTRFDDRDLFYSLSSTIHEVGHALYEQGLPQENFGTPLAESISLGIHESQSRVWENQLGRSRAFWRYFYPILQRAFPRPFKKIKFEDFYKAINIVMPSLIRTEADEVTYNLHIILRFEMERDLIEGKLEAKDAPHVWNEKMKEYFGIVPKTDREGILQDIHWSAGLFGYFPTYTLGNLYSAQFYNAAKKQIRGLEKQFEKGNFTRFRDWLGENIHMHGKYYCATELCKKVTGEKLNPKHFMNYLATKYSEIYKI